MRAFNINIKQGHQCIVVTLKDSITDEVLHSSQSKGILACTESLKDEVFKQIVEIKALYKNCKVKCEGYPNSDCGCSHAFRS